MSDEASDITDRYRQRVLCAHTHVQVRRSGGNAAGPDAKFNKSLIFCQSVGSTPSGDIISLIKGGRHLHQEQEISLRSGKERDQKQLLS